MVMGMAPPTAAAKGVVATHMGVEAITGALETAWFIILLLTTSMGLVTAVPTSPATKLALRGRGGGEGGRREREREDTIIIHACDHQNWRTGGMYQGPFKIVCANKQGY